MLCPCHAGTLAGINSSSSGHQAVTRLDLSPLASPGGHSDARYGRYWFKPLRQSATAGHDRRAHPAPIDARASNGRGSGPRLGFNHDGTHYFPLPRFGNSRGLLVVNHEYTDASQIHSDAQGSAITSGETGRRKVAKALAAHGVSVIAIQKASDGKWDVVAGEPRNRRITGTTPMQFSGPVRANHPMLRSTITPSPLEARYGVTSSGFNYNWHKAEPRFDLALKRSALGRIKLEGATCTESKGRVVVYSGYDGIGNNAMLAAVPETGESTTFWNSQNGSLPTTTNPSTVSNWPYGNPSQPRRPRPATVVIRRMDGGRIGA
jgi:secreted PhoX family phosphatase